MKQKGAEPHVYTANLAQPDEDDYDAIPYQHWQSSLFQHDSTWWGSNRYDACHCDKRR